MFCAVCKAAGKSEQEYTSHFVRESRDQNARVVCPVLLKTVCRYCKKTGHTKSHCKQLKARNDEREHQKKTASEFKPSKYEKGSFTIGEAIAPTISHSEENRKWLQKHCKHEPESKFPVFNSIFAQLDSDSEDEHLIFDKKAGPINKPIREQALPYGAMIRRSMKEEAEKPAAVEVAKIVKRIETKDVMLEFATSHPHKKEEPNENLSFNFLGDFDSWADAMDADESQNKDGEFHTPENYLSYAKSESDSSKKQVKFGVNMVFEFENDEEDRLARGGR